jgi:hypothetical protein
MNLSPSRERGRKKIMLAHAMRRREKGYLRMHGFVEHYKIYITRFANLLALFK